MTQREWYGRVLVAMFGVNTVLAVVVALVAVSRFELNGGFDVFYWLVFVGPAAVVGFLAALAAWSATVGTSVALATFLPRVPRSAAVTIGLLTPGVIALLVYRPWVEASEIAQPAQLPELVFGLVMGSTLAVMVVHRANQAAARSLLPKAE